MHGAQFVTPNAQSQIRLRDVNSDFYIFFHYKNLPIHPLFDLVLKILALVSSKK